MNEKNETFTYTYSAAQQEEIEAIRKKYLPTGERESKMERLRRLDASVTQKGLTLSLIVGVLGTLMLGGGMSLIMTDLGKSLGITAVMAPGLVLGIVGMIGVIAAYPLYQRITRKERAKVAPEILRLTEELSQS